MAEEKKTPESTEKKAAPKKAAPKKAAPKKVAPKKVVPKPAPVVEEAPKQEAPKPAPVVEKAKEEKAPEKTGFEITVGVGQRVTAAHGSGLVVSRGTRKEKGGSSFGVFVVKLDNGEVRDYTQDTLRPE